MTRRGSLRLLLDSHIPTRVAVLLRARGHDVTGLAEWHSGQYRDAPDETLLLLAHEEHRALLTYDVNTIPDLIRELGEAGVDHSGVIFVSRRTMAQDDIGTPVRALERLLLAADGKDFRNRVEYLPRP